MDWTVYQIVIIITFTLTGALNTILVKFADLQESEGIDGNVRQYNHPFVQSSQMFLGMMLDFFIFKILYYSFKYKSEEKAETHKFTKGNRVFNVLIFWLPALCDMVSTSTLYVALNLTYASSFQMLRGAVIVFTALLSYPCFGRVPSLMQFFGIFLVILGLTMVGVSDYLDKSESEDAKETLLIVTGDLMIVASQFLTATQVILEEKYVVTKDVPPLQAVGWEGIFGFSSTAVAHIPLYFIYVGVPFSHNSRGTLEDVPDAFVQMYNNWVILLATIATILSLAVYNFCGVTVSKELNSTTRKVLDSLRTVIIWIVSMCAFGQRFQYIQLLSFIVLVFGMAFYSDMGCTQVKNKLCPPKASEETEEPPK